MLSLGTWRYGAGALYAAILGSGLVAAAEKPKAAGIDPLFTGTVLPVPPQQGRPWTAPAVKLSQKWMDGVRFLVGRGYADPRGCEYRDVRLAFGGQTHAWVIPQGRGERADNARFAVSWDGSVYPVMKIGATASVKDDVEALLLDAARHKRRRERAVGGSFDDATGFGSGGLQDMEVWVGGIARSAEGCSETELVSHSSLLGLKSCTLMLLGEATLAERAWNTWIDQGGAEHWGKPTTRTDDRILAEEWAWALFLRAVDAHRRGDDAIATHDAKSLIQLWKGEPSHSFFRNWPQRIAEDGEWRLRERHASSVPAAERPENFRFVAADHSPIAEFGGGGLGRLARVGHVDFAPVGCGCRDVASRPSACQGRVARDRTAAEMPCQPPTPNSNRPVYGNFTASRLLHRDDRPGILYGIAGNLQDQDFWLDDRRRL